MMQQINYKDLPDLRFINTSKAKHYNGEALMLPIRQREKLAKKQ